MKLKGIDGEVSAKGYERWIELYDIDFGGLHIPMDNVVGKNQNRVNSKPRLGDITITKPLDTSSTRLFDRAHDAQSFPEVEIHYVTNGNPPIKYASYILHNVLLSNYSERHTGSGDRPIEMLALNYLKIEKTYIPRGSDNQPKNPMIIGYDLSTMSVT